MKKLLFLLLFPSLLFSQSWIDLMQEPSNNFYDTQKEFEDFSMDMTYSEIIQFNMESTWVTKTVATTLIEGFDPMKQMTNKAVVTRTVVVD